MSEARDDVTIPSGNSYLAAWVYRPDPANASGTCVVMAHGFSLTRHDGLDRFAETFRNAGATVVVFDYRYLGDSGGEPRLRFRKKEQIADWQAAVAFARRLDSVDPDRVALWGYSFSGGHCTYVAAEDSRIAAVLLLCPFLDGVARIRATPLKTLAWITPRAALDMAGHHNTIPVTGPAGSMAAMALAGEEAGFSSVLGDHSPWRNAISPGVFLTAPAHRPWSQASALKMPVWVALGDQDISAPPVGIHRLVKRSPDVELRRYQADHFTVFTEPLGAQIARDQTQFLIDKGLLRACGAT